MVADSRVLKQGEEPGFVEDLDSQVVGAPLGGGEHLVGQLLAADGDLEVALPEVGVVFLGPGVDTATAAMGGARAAAGNGGTPPQAPTLISRR